MMGLDGHRHYFRFRPAMHHYVTDCPGPVDVGLYRYENFKGEITETTIRVVCFNCGAVSLFDFKGDIPTERYTSTEAIGYGSKPDKVLGLFLWPTAPIFDRDERGPWAFYVTRIPARPTEVEDPIGVVSWSLGSRGGVHWHAGIGISNSGGVKREAGQTFASRRAAVAWLASETAEAKTES